MANIAKLRLSGVTYAIYDESAIHSLEGYTTKEDVRDAVTGASAVIGEELDKKADKTELDGLFGYVTYDNGEKKILFKHSETGATIGEVDATDFIKDAFLDKVELVDGKLVFTWNTESGKDVTEIDVSKIFDPENYYSKEQADKQFGTLEEQKSLRNDVEQALGEVASLESDMQKKANKDDVYERKDTYTKDEIDKKITESGTFDPSLYMQKSEIEAALATKNQVISVEGDTLIIS